MTESQSLHALARRFFEALSAGDVPDEMLTEDMTVWTLSGSEMERDQYRGAVRMLHSLFRDGIAFTIDAMTAEEDRIAAEARSHGILKDGREYGLRYVFMLRIRDGKIAHIDEYFDPRPVDETLRPLLIEAMQ